MDLPNTIYALAENESINSQLPGRQDGPADAYRHILAAAEAVRQGYPESFVRTWGLLREWDNPSVRATMDEHNNDVGIRIGSEATSWEDLLQRVRDTINQGETFSQPSDKASWLPERAWRGNPLNENTTEPNDRLSTNQTNWPPRWPNGDSPTNPNWWKAFPPTTLPEAWKQSSGDLNANGLPDILESLQNTYQNDAKRTISPLILDLDGDGVETTAAGSGTYFDHDANGFAESTGWAGADDGLLVRDIDGNDRIDSGRELFGTETLLTSANNAGAHASNGFAALAELDSVANGGNADGKLDASDAAFASLNIWKDTDADGYTSAGELLTLTEAGIQSIHLAYTESTNLPASTDSNGNIHQLSGSYTKSDGSSAAATDVWFTTKADGSSGSMGEVSGNLADVNLASDTFHSQFADQHPPYRTGTDPAGHAGRRAGVLIARGGE